MKKLLLSIIAVFAFMVAANAQEGLFRLNAGLALGTEAGYDGAGLGINVGGEYFFIDEVSASPSFTYFFKSTETFGNEEVSIRLSSFNIDGRYYFINDDLQVYGIAGIAILSITSDIPNFSGGTFSVSDSETGLNIGGGVVYPLTDKIGLNGQLKYQTPGEGQLVLNAGVAISLNN